MAIRHKRKNSAGYTWQTGDLVEGQIGLNIADGTLHFDKADGSTVTIAPITDTDTTYAISAETNAAGADLRLTGSDASTDNVTLAAGTGITVTRTDANTVTIDSTGVSETLRTYVYNADSVTLTKGMPVYVFGAQGQNISVKRAINTGDAGSAQTLGLVEANIASGAEGYVVTFGEIENMNTDGYTEGAGFYLGSTAGSITFTKPYAPNHLVYLGFVEKAHASSGRVFVKPQNGYELDEIHDVNIDHNVALNVGDYLRRNTANTLWENSPLYISDDGAPQLGGNLDVNGNSIVSVSNGDITLAPDGTGKVIISGDLQIDGTTTTINSTTLDVDDINITIAKGAANAAAANGGGITLEGPATAATITYASATDSWNLNKKTNVVGDVKITSDNAVGAPGGPLSLVTTAGTSYIDFSPGDQQINFSGNGFLTGTGFNLTATNIALAASGGYVKIGTGSGAGTLTSDGSYNLVLNTNSGTNSGNITIAQGANGNITIEPNGNGDVYLNADTVRVGDSAATATITSNGAGNLVLNTNAGTNSGSITIGQGTNGNISLACNGTGVVFATSPIIASITSGTNNAPMFARHTVTASASDTNPSINIQKARSDIAFSSMTNEPAIVNYQVRDNTNANRSFFRLIGRYLGTATNPQFTLRGSADGFTTTLDYFTFGGGVGTFGTSSNNYTLTSNTGGALVLTANANTTSGTITIASSTNANISITPNGTGKTVITNAVPYEYVYTGGSTTGTITPDAANGTIQSITLTGSITFNAFGTPLAGQTITMIIKQPASGGPYTLTSTMLFAGASKTLSTAANAVDILSVTYDGTNYWASLSKGYA